MAKVKQSYFVGGGWGATSEKRMMKEILRNGPINGDMQAPETFALYKKGIFSEQGMIDLKMKSQRSNMLAYSEGLDSELL